MGGVEVASGERLLAWAPLLNSGAGSAAAGGTREALYLPGDISVRTPTRLAWEQIASADWDQESSTLRVVEVGRFGEPTPVHAVELADAGRLLQLVRERVTASIVVQRHAPVAARRSVRILGRRAPSGRGEIAWFIEYDDGLDPLDPAVDAVVQRALAGARADVGV